MNKITQKKIILDFCKANTWITQRDAYKLGIYRLASRIWDMDEEGCYKIIRETIRVENADGSYSYVKRYSVTEREEIAV